MSLFYRVLLSIATLGIGMGVILLIVILPTVSNMRVLSQAIDEERARIENTTSGALGLRSTASDVQKVKSFIPKLMELFIKPGREIELFTLLEKEGRQSELTQRLRLGEPQPAKHALLALPLEIELKGDLVNTLNFINRLEKSPLLLPLESIDLQLNPTVGESNQELTSMLRGTAYVRK